MAKLRLNSQFYVWSSHKTATQTLVATFNTVHIHTLSDSNYTEESLLEDLNQYKKRNKRKLKILTVLRIPHERTISSWFQIHHSDYAKKHDCDQDETPVMNKSIDELVEEVEEWIKQKRVYCKESLYQMMELFDFTFDDIKMINKEKGYAFYENDLFELYILDFDRIIRDHGYLDNIFNKKYEIKARNVSENKMYHERYNKVKDIIGKKYDDFIDSDHPELIELKKKLNKTIV